MVFVTIDDDLAQGVRPRDLPPQTKYEKVKRIQWILKHSLFVYRLPGEHPSGHWPKVLLQATKAVG